MKIQSRDVGLVAISFFLGALFCFLLVQVITPPSSVPHAAAALVLAAAHPQAGESVTELSQIRGRKVEVILPMREVQVIDPHTGLAVGGPRSLDLIDFRHQQF